jgi:predicted ATPase/class 3 adenylate cyclase/Tfp pilus assembly protein PilF
VSVNPYERKSETFTFLFTDIEGSTKLWEAKPDAMRVALAQHDAMLRRAIEEHGGHVFKTVGDAFCAAFPSAAHAIGAAVQAQRALKDETFIGIGSLHVRMALHTGEAQLRANDYFGPTLNRVARLLSLAYGDQILLSNTAQEMVSDELPEDCHLRDLGSHTLKDLQKPENVYQLIAEGLPQEFPALKSLDALPNNLPRQITNFIGREQVLQEVKDLLSTSSLLTLMGTGGTGKTRLSLQVAADLLDAHPDGVYFIELAPVTDPGMIPYTLSHVLGVREEPGKPLIHTIAAYLKPKKMLLVFDNCEHIVEATSRLIHSLLQAAPDLKVLASSRETLSIAGEVIYRVPPLSLPPAARVADKDKLLGYESVRLFLERAGLVQPGFALTDDSAEFIAEICRRLDGIPLAIELAAARVKVLSVEQILARLNDRFKLLTGGSRTGLPHQQTLRAAIDWSYDLLTESERAVFARTGIFAGHWTIEATEFVGEGGEIESWEVLDLLVQLVDKSLIIAETLGDETYYRMLESVREYALERLEGSGEFEEVATKHFDHFLAMVEEAEPKLAGEEQGVWLEKLNRTYDNFRAAIARMAKTDPKRALSMASALSQFWFLRGRLGEARATMRDLLHLYPENDEVRARGLAVKGSISIRQGDFEAAQRLCGESLEIRRQLGDKKGAATLLGTLGVLAQKRGDFAAAKELLHENLETQRELGNQMGTANSLGALGNIARFEGDTDQAWTYYEESLSLRRKLGHTAGIADLLNSMAALACSRQDYERAAELSREALAKFNELGDPQGLAESLETLAMIVAAAKQHDQTATLLGAAEALREQIGAPLSPGERADYDRQVAESKESLGETAFIHNWSFGRRMTADEATEFALSPGLHA